MYACGGPETDRHAGGGGSSGGGGGGSGDPGGGCMPVVYGSARLHDSLVFRSGGAPIVRPLLAAPRPVGLTGVWEEHVRLSRELRCALAGQSRPAKTGLWGSCMP